jgi:hypothetical protein
MKRHAAVALTAATLFFARSAHADPRSILREPAVVTDEAGDAWLHDHCAFRGLASPAIANLDVPGQVLELLSDQTAKEFRCAARPPFWQGSWAPAAPEVVACTASTTVGICVPPLGTAVAAPSVATATTAAPAVAPRPAAPKPRASAANTFGWFLVGTGIVGIVTAGAAGGLVLDAKATTANHCDGFKTCDEQGLRAAERGKTASLVGTIAFAAGATALAGGIVVLAVTKPREQKQVQVVARPSTAGASFGLEGRF